MNDNVIQGKKCLLSEKLIKGIELTVKRRLSSLNTRSHMATYKSRFILTTPGSSGPNISGAKVSAMVEPTQIGNKVHRVSDWH